MKLDPHTAIVEADRDEDGIASDALAKLDAGVDIEKVTTSALAVLNRSAIETQIDMAQKHPRSIRRFLTEAATLATLTREVAESCVYTLPRGGKSITGPSVRLAEICVSAYGNLDVAARVIGVEDKQVVAQGVCLDLQRNVRVAIEVRRRITRKNGQLFDDDMIAVTGAAAASIALRNAVFRVVPRAYVDTIYAKAREVAVGDARTLADRRVDVIARLGKMGVPQDRVFARLGRAAIEDVTLDDLETLIGLGTAIRNNDTAIDDAFPPVQAPQTQAPAEEGRRISLRGKKQDEKAEREPGID